MAGASLTTAEIAIIKSLLSTKAYNNQEILGLVNAARRLEGVADTNGGRISELRSFSNNKLTKLKPPQIKRFTDIAEATPAERESFLSRLKDTQALPVATNLSPVDEKVIREILPIKTETPLILNITETERVECKENFNFVMKTAAAFSNNRGGYFVFGVKNKTWEVVGLKDEKVKIFEEYDLKKVSAEIRNKLGIDLSVQKKLIDIRGKKIGIFFVDRASIKPVIYVSNDDGGIAQGHIYYRYAGEDRLISPQDLQRLIEERIRQLSETVLMKHLSNILKFGIENTAVMNTMTGEVSGKGGKFLIDEALLPKLSFIREGEFQETDGAPALRLVGDVQATGKIIVKGKGVITDTDLLEDFINQAEVQAPDEYIKHLAHTQAAWLPIFYYMKKAGLDKSAASALLDSTDGKKGQIAFQKQRINKGKLPKAAGKKSSYAQEIADLKSGVNLASKNKQQISRYFWAFHLLENSDITKEAAFSFLKKHFDKLYKQGASNDKSLYRATASKIDAIYFGQ